MWNSKTAMKAYNIFLFYVSEKTSIYLHTADETPGFTATGGLGSKKYLLTDALFQSREVLATYSPSCIDHAWPAHVPQEYLT